MAKVKHGSGNDNGANQLLNLVGTVSTLGVPNGRLHGRAHGRHHGKLLCIGCCVSGLVLYWYLLLNPIKSIYFRYTQ